MKAIGLRHYLPLDHPESLLDIELPKPSPPRGHDLLVSVRAVSVNPVDAKERSRGTKTEDPPRVLGWDAAGVVEAVGESVTGFQPGDEVYYAGAITKPGCNAEFHLVDERIVGSKPRKLSFADAAALPLTTLTAWEALFDRARIDSQGGHHGRSVLIVGGAGGVGSVAIQLAKQVGRLKVIATASRPESAQWCRELGADEVVDHNGDLLAQLQAKGIAGVDYVLVTSSPDKYFAALVQAVLPQGHIVSILPIGEQHDFSPLFRKSVSFSFELMFTRSMFTTPDILEQHHILTRVAGLVDSGVLRSTVNEVLHPINAATLKRAHGMIESGKTIGKVVLEGF